MKISGNFEGNFYKYFNEANGVILNKKNLINNPKSKVHSYTTTMTFYILVSVLVLLTIFIWFSFFNLICFKWFISIIINLLILMIPVIYIQTYLLSKSFKDFKSGSVYIGKNFSWENSKGYKITTSYDNMEAVIITDNLMVFVLDVPLMFIIKNENKKKVISEIRKNSDVLIVDKSTY